MESNNTYQQLRDEYNKQIARYKQMTKSEKESERGNLLFKDILRLNKQLQDIERSIPMRTSAKTNYNPWQ
jgi:hypothetical protein